MNETKHIDSSQEATRGFFDSIAGWERWRVFEPAERDFAEFVAAMTPIRPGDYVLEPGCGAGRMSRLLGRSVGDSGWVMAVDVSEAMIEKARDFCSSSPVSFSRASVHRVPLESATMDAVVCFNSFQHFICPPRALAEMARVLRPGGRLAIANAESPDDLVRIDHLPAAMRGNLMPPLGDLLRMLAAFGFTVKKFPRFDSYFFLVAERGDDGKGSGISSEKGGA